jgi:hypothetical protein
MTIPAVIFLVNAVSRFRLFIKHIDVIRRPEIDDMKLTEHVEDHDYPYHQAGQNEDNSFACFHAFTGQTRIFSTSCTTAKDKTTSTPRKLRTTITCSPFLSLENGPMIYRDMTIKTKTAAMRKVKITMETDILICIRASEPSIGLPESEVNKKGGHNRTAFFLTT